MTKSRINWASGISLAEVWLHGCPHSKEGPIPEQQTACQQGKPCDCHQGIGNASTSGTTKLTSHCIMWSLFPEIAWRKRASYKLFYPLKLYNLIWILFIHCRSTHHKDKMAQDQSSLDFPFLFYSQLNIKNSQEYKEFLQTPRDLTIHVTGENAFGTRQFNHW